MELLFLLILVMLMITSLSSGFPVAFALPGSAILSVGLAALCGYIFADNINAYFAHDGPVQWLSTGVTNFRGIYWEVERDTLIAIPLFIFMGIMLEKSKIAEDLLVRMAQLFGPVPGGLGVSVIFVGAMLAATTGIVGATVVAMGLISLPAMLRNNYSPSLASGAICASGTLGQIIPPSVVLIILVDQLSNAVDQAGTIRKAEYKLATGEFSMPTEFAISSASAGEMFLGAFVPGLILVGLYTVYILIYGALRPKLAPPVPYDGKYDRKFALQVGLALVPPLVLIFLVLGSIIAGVATVNQAGAIGAIGAIIMGGYRLFRPSLYAFLPAILSILSLIGIFTIASNFDLNIKSIDSTTDTIGILLVLVPVLGLFIGIIWSIWRIFRINNTLTEVMIETTKTTSLVFIILIGAAMLTAAFRGFGGEDLVRDFLTSLPGGFWTQFIVVMLVIFILGFFLDFIEIAVVVMPIVAPILLANTEANVTAIWVGVMVGLNIQTSFLTPPFGFALFYLRGVASKALETLSIYRGVVAFIILQLVALVIVGSYPPLVNYLPNRAYLTSSNSPPPRNPRLQKCLEDNLFTTYASHQDKILADTQALASLALPPSLPSNTSESKAYHKALENVSQVFVFASAVQDAEAKRLAYLPEYKPLLRQVRTIQRQNSRLDRNIAKLKKDKRNLAYSENVSAEAEIKIEAKIASLQAEKVAKLAKIPVAWKSIRASYAALTDEENKARRAYRRLVDDIFETLQAFETDLQQAGELAQIKPDLLALRQSLEQADKAETSNNLKAMQKRLGTFSGDGVYDIKSLVGKASKAFDKDGVSKSLPHLDKAIAMLEAMLAWQLPLQAEIGNELNVYVESIRNTIGLRLQERLPKDIAVSIAACQSHHRDLSLHF